MDRLLDLRGDTLKLVISGVEGYHKNPPEHSEGTGSGEGAGRGLCSPQPLLLSAGGCFLRWGNIPTENIFFVDADF